MSLLGEREKLFSEKEGVGFKTYYNCVYRRPETGGKWSPDSCWKNLVYRRSRVRCVFCVRTKVHMSAYLFVYICIHVTRSWTTIES